ncbi:hypothetical protein EP232_04935, partial [bacterium]
MRRLSLAALAVVLVATGASVAMADEVSDLYLGKNCVIFGRLLDHKIVLGGAEVPSDVDAWFPRSMELNEFEIVNTSTGEKHAVVVSEDGHFCLKLDSGSYLFQKKDSTGSVYVFDRVVIPFGKMVNVGTYRVETKSHPVFDRWDWSNYSRGPYSSSVRLVHLSDEVSYGSCE